MLVIVLGEFDLQVLVLTQFVSDDVLDLPDLVSLRPFLVLNLILDHFLDVLVLLRLLLKLLGFLLRKVKLRHPQGLHVRTMPQVLHSYSLPRFLLLLLSCLLSISLGLLPSLLLPLDHPQLLRPLLHPFNGPHHLRLLLVKEADPVLQGLRILLCLLFGLLQGYELELLLGCQ